MAQLDQASYAELNRLAQLAGRPTADHRAIRADCWNEPSGAITTIGDRALPHLYRMTNKKAQMPIYVREDYRAAFDEILKLRRRVVQGGRRLLEGLTVTGQPGIGKSRFLDYALLRLLESAIPTILVSTSSIDTTATLFLDAGCFRIPAADLGSLDFLVPPVILCDSREQAGPVPEHLYDTIQPSVFVLATSTKEERWRESGEVLDASYFVMKPVPPQEFVDVLLLRMSGPKTNTDIDNQQRAYPSRRVSLASLSPSIPTTSPSLQHLERPPAEPAEMDYVMDELDLDFSPSSPPALAGLELLGPIDLASEFFHPLELYEMNGPTFRPNLKEYVSRSGDTVMQVIGRYDPSAILHLASAFAAAMADEQIAEAHQRAGFHRFFFEVPVPGGARPTGGNPQTRIIVPTKFIRQILREAFRTRARQEQLDFLRLCKSEGQLLGVVFEAVAINHLSRSIRDPPVTLTFPSGTSPLTVPAGLPHLTTDPRVEAIPYQPGVYALPPGFPSIDAIIVLPGTLNILPHTPSLAGVTPYRYQAHTTVLVQATVAKRHAVKARGIELVLNAIDRRAGGRNKRGAVVFAFASLYETVARDLADYEYRSLTKHKIETSWVAINPEELRESSERAFLRHLPPFLETNSPPLGTN